MSARTALVVLAVAAAAAVAVALLRSSPDPGGNFAYYTLALSWSPTYCETEDPKGRTAQCRGAPRAFILHGFWPQYERGWPKNCYSGKRPWVPEAVIDGMTDIMPSRGLIIHQYAKHGTCSGLSPETYFDAARAAFEAVRVPERLERLDRPLETKPADIEAAFLAANPELEPDMVAVRCGPERLREVRVCFSKKLGPRSCGANENQARLCPTPTTRVPPVR
ncbi:ribonuclease T2 family protein [Dichotomicrobium thermohalophilum]|uniref:Ribonuclease T2 n=1 Tax=Dichotomicrobium thermohalophilum TaxID=933063 RepID=A0A397Q627_9HYPH|nr:ribonuclease T2 [Dichotomicrobium thermohalophilum]RIA56413.1 ribonuclease T2 [Dichotomicrobium thermohalophilum]